MNVGDLPFPAADAALQTTGLVVAFGPFAVRLKIREPALARALYDLYAAYPVADADRTVVFCEVAVVGERSWRSFLRRGFAIYADGQRRGSSLDLPLALPSLEWTINYVIATTAHRYVMIHAAVIERNGQALIMPGNPGSGKSTLCAALIGRGWRLLSDEFGLLQPEDGLLVPMPRPISLKNRSIDLIRSAAPQMRFGPVVGGTPKGNVALAAPPVDDIRRQHERVPPRWIVLPTWTQESASASLTPLSRSQAFANLTEHAINYEIAGEAGFRAIRGMVESCPAYRLSFSDTDDALNAIEQLDEAAGAPHAVTADVHVR